ncbi:MAG: response regulator transcription factor [Spirochaetaceae bacterium]|nr:response regulator transcription factor [Spirochaetaceae bacterium]
MEELKEQKIKLLLVDDQVIFTESLATCISNYAEDIEITGMAQNGQEAVDEAIRTVPDVIVMDVRMPVMDGVEAVRQIRSLLPAIKIIMLSTYKEDILVRNALLEGASGYLLKNISPHELIAAIRALNRGVLQVSPELIQSLVGKKEEENSKNIDLLKELTTREKEIALLLINGYGNEQIAEKLNLAIQTVRNQVSNIYFKLGVKDRFEMIRLSSK